MIQAIKITAVFLALSASAAFCTPADSTTGLRDVFPIHVGNSWRYSYSSSESVHDMFHGDYWSDALSGWLTYTILDSTLYMDEMLWRVGITRSLHYTYSNSDTTYNYPIEDTVKIYLYELLTGNHWLTAQRNPVWRFSNDTALGRVFRYRKTDSTGSIRQTVWVPDASPYGSTFTFTFSSDTGLTGAYSSFSINTMSFSTQSSLETSILVTVPQSNSGSAGPLAISLAPNYPNPFNPFTNIRYTIDGARGPGLGARKTSLVVYDVLGRLVATLVDEVKAPGSYEVRFDGSGLTSGVYIYRLTAGSFVRSRKMILMK